MKKLGVWLIVAVVLLVATANAQRGSAVRSAWEYKMVYVMGFGLSAAELVKRREGTLNQMGAARHRKALTVHDTSQLRRSLNRGSLVVSLTKAVRPNPAELRPAGGCNRDSSVKTGQRTNAVRERAQTIEVRVQRATTSCPISSSDVEHDVAVQRDHSTLR